MGESELLKKDLFGEIRREFIAGEERIVRDVQAASRWVRWLSRLLLRREARILAVLSDVGGIPPIRQVGRSQLQRVYLSGSPLNRARPRDPAYFRSAARLLRTLHKLGVIHNDLAKEPNLLVLDDGSPAFIDFQLAAFSRRRGPLFRLLAHEDLRHLIKHKNSYCPGALTRRERNILASPSLVARCNRCVFKPVYLFLTRRMMGWADREGSGKRGDSE